MDVTKLLSDKGQMIIVVHLGETIRSVVRILADRKIGALVVKDENEMLAGIISERDIVKGLNDFGPDLMAKPVDELITSSVITCSPDDSLVEIMWSMDANGIRHLPVVDGQDLVGIISIRDVMGAWLDANEEESEQLRELISA